MTGRVPCLQTLAFHKLLSAVPEEKAKPLAREFKDFCSEETFTRVWFYPFDAKFIATQLQRVCEDLYGSFEVTESRCGVPHACMAVLSPADVANFVNLLPTHFGILRTIEEDLYVQYILVSRERSDVSLTLALMVANPVDF